MTSLMILSQGPVLMHTRHQYAVGQGGFHLGELVAPGENSLIQQGQGTVEVFANRKFTYVYDCGSNAAESSSIE
ncbi:hypothetical protein ABIB85_007507 [Bradyrhizobium sp. JR1.5]|uniref:hypothetical protein n=1 Tax=unclassified Bradyrhizobium TaxID=2631580 RepID=UPI003397A8C5